MKYLDRSKILGYQATLIFTTARRGIGKSWTAKDYSIYHAATNSEKKSFIYLRRYKNELKANKTKLLDNMQDSVTSLGRYTLKGDTYYLDNRPIGYAVPLSCYTDYKSVPFERVSNVIFDEFIPENKRIKGYLADECEAFASFMSTVLRNRREFNDSWCRFWCIGNLSESITPYNAYFHLPPFDKKYFDKERGILVYPSDLNNIQEGEKGTQLERALRGTTYYDFNFNNKPISEDMSYVRPMPQRGMRCMLVVRVGGVDLGIYYEFTTGDLYISTKCDPCFYNKVTIDRSLPDNYVYLHRKMVSSKIIKNALYAGRVFYDDLKAKILAEEFIKYVK